MPEKKVFDLLEPQLAEIVKARFGEPTATQEKGIPAILSGENILLMAPTGTGKTESVLIPIFNFWLKKKPQPISILYITPLKALNRDMLDRISWWAQKLGFGVSVRHGDTTQRERKLQSEHPDDLFITTPEQMQAMITGKKFREFLKNVNWIVIYEAHELVDSKRGVQLTLALERLKILCGKPQIIALSATVGSPEQAAKFLFNDSEFQIVNSVGLKELDIKIESPAPSKEDREVADKIFIGEAVVCRLRKIHELMQKARSILVFTNTREAAEVLSSRLRSFDKDLAHEVHHSSLSKESRISAEKKFKEEKLKTLIATSSLQLGIDIGSIDLVIQYQSPREVSQIVQRVGRAGHGVGRVSNGIIIAGEGDDIFESAVIARKAKAGELEPLRFHEKSLDVLAHQIIGISNDEYKIDAKKALKIIRGAYPYRNLSDAEFLSMLKFLEQLRMLWSNEGLKRGRKGLKYYFENLSVIPDNKNYRVIDFSANAAIGTLDEGFVAEHSDPGSTFIFKGRPWRVIQIEKEKVYVEPSAEIESAIPAWTGELMPVPRAVAQEVGKLRKIISEKKISDSAIAEIRKFYSVSTQAAAKMFSLIEKQKEFFVPDVKTLAFETYKEFTVLHSCNGSLANETLARFVSAIISAESGRAVAAKSDPYRIVFSLVKPEEIKNILLEHRPEEIETILKLALPNSSLFKHRFIQVGKRFGVISKDASFDRINMDKLISVYRDSPLFTETMNEIFIDKLDLAGAEEILLELQAGKISIQEFRGLSPLGEEGLKYELRDIAKPDRPEAEILKIFKQRLLATRVRIVCMNCGKYSVAEPAGELAKELRCPLCTSKLLACVHPHMTEAQEIIKKRLKGKELSEEEQKKLEKLRRSADAIVVYGKFGAIALAGRGVGPQTAMRVMAKAMAAGKGKNISEDELYKEILNAEREFIRTKKFWAD